MYIHFIYFTYLRSALKEKSCFKYRKQTSVCLHRHLSACEYQGSVSLDWTVLERERGDGWEKLKDPQSNHQWPARV